MRIESALAMLYPGVTPTFPAGSTLNECKATTTSGLGNFVISPSSTIFFAPEIVSSAGCPKRISVPCHVFLVCAITSAVPISDAMCRSCPHACITGTSLPLSSFACTLLAYGRPVFSSTGSASSSVRSMMIGPVPFFITATMPVPPTLSVTA